MHKALPEKQGVSIFNLLAVAAFLVLGASSLTLNKARASGPGPGSTISLSPSSLSFSTQAIGTSSASQSIAITNSGAAELNLYGFNVPAPFVLTSTPPVPDTLMPGETTHVNVAFAPGSEGSFPGTLTVMSDASSGASFLPLSGNGVGASPLPEISVSPGALNFGTQPAGTTGISQSVVISNTGNAELVLSGLTADAPFVITSSPPIPITLMPGETTHASIAFAPSSDGGFSGDFTVSSNAPSSSPICLVGAGQTDPPIPPISASFFGLSLQAPTQWPDIPFGSVGHQAVMGWAPREPQQDVFDFSSLDSYVAEMQSHRISSFIYDLGGDTPSWAGPSSC